MTTATPTNHGTRPLRILHYLDDFDFSLGGVVQYVFQLCRVLAEHEMQVTLITGRDRDIPESWKEPSSSDTPRAITLDQPPGYRGKLNHTQVQQLTSAARDHDIVHLHGPWDFGNIQFARQLYRCNIPYIVSAHGMLDDWSLRQNGLQKKLFLRLVAGRILRRAAIVHCTATAEQEQVERNVGCLNNTSCVVPLVPLPAVTSQFENRQLVYEAFPAISPDKIKLLFLSRIHFKKGMDVLLDALSILNKSGQDMQLLVAGGGEDQYVDALKDLARQYGVAGQVVWLGMVRDPLKSELFHQSDLLVLPTRQENFGIVLVEAMAMGLPVVTTRGTDIWRELEQGGAVISELSAGELATSILDMIKDPAELGARGKRGAEYVRDWLDESRVIQAQRRMYQQAVNRAAASTTASETHLN